ncbi:hypothetical protein CK203_019419 [Vitis vinifera]|uniref:Uncharacterized protein n=1 Tax=Vitis vinifera TaxID=29760 RepID=A0A438IZB8_VITVI|nr:hypothetical protein CK203_019419 [Vitis vinifera]
MTAENSPKIEEEVKYMEEMSYASVVGSIMYAMGSTDVGILYGDGAIGELGVVEGYVDSDYAGSADTRKSLTGYVFTCLVVL